MLVRDLIERLNKMPANAPVYLYQKVQDIPIETLAAVEDLQLLASPAYGEAVAIEAEEL